MGTNVHTILDLDLDVFSWPIVTGLFRTPEPPEDHESQCASVEDVRFFLEQQCGLSVSKRLLGAEVITHDAAFDTWARWIDAGTIDVPFAVIHVDAHADMGMGDAGWAYLMSELLALPVEERRQPRRGSDALNEGNYLMFAAANRWFSNLKYVYPALNPWERNWQSGRGVETEEGPFTDGAPGDLMVMHFRNEDWRTGELVLKHCSREVIDRCFGRKLSPVIRYEPGIPFSCEEIPQFRFASFTHILLARSPNYSAPCAHGLLPVIREYFAEAKV